LTQGVYVSHLSRASFELVGFPEIKMLSHKSTITTFPRFCYSKCNFREKNKSGKYSFYNK
jgi:hypothetical protein